MIFAHVDKDMFYKILIYFFMLLTVLQCNSIYIYLEPPFYISGSYISILWTATLLMLIALRMSSIRYNNNIIAFIFTLIIFLFVLYIVNMIKATSFNFSGNNFLVKIVIDQILLITFFCSFSSLKFIKLIFIIFKKIVLVISMISLLSWILFICHVPTNVTVLSSWGVSKANPIQEYSYFGLDFFTKKPVKFLGISWIRNNGIFTEPSMFAYVVLIALLVDLFVQNNKSICSKSTLLLLLVILSTDSTTGILLAFPAIIYHAMLISSRYDASRFLIVMILPIIALFLYYVLGIKAHDSSNILSSFGTRCDDILAGFKTWIHYPLFGCGIGNLDPIRNNMNPLRFSVMNSMPADSSGFSSILSGGGIMLSLYYLLPEIFIYKHRKYLYMSIALLIAFFFTTSQGLYIYIMLLSYFWIIILKPILCDKDSNDINCK